MILPGKHLRADRALISIGGDVLQVLTMPTQVSALWERVLAFRATREDASPLSFDWFVMALSLLYAIKAVDLESGLIKRAVQ